MNFANKVIIFLLFLSSFLLSGCSTNWRGYYARRIAHGSYEHVAHGAKLKAQETRNKTVASQYYLYAGLANQYNNKQNEAINCYLKSIKLEDKYNYFSYLQMAKTYRLEANSIKEKKYLKLTIEAIDNLKKKVDEGLTFSEQYIYPTIEFYVGYYVFNESIERQNQDFIKRLEVRKKEIQELISKQSKLKK